MEELQSPCRILEEFDGTDTVIHRVGDELDEYYSAAWEILRSGRGLSSMLKRKECEPNRTKSFERLTTEKEALQQELILLRIEKQQIEAEAITQADIQRLEIEALEAEKQAQIAELLLKSRENEVMLSATDLEEHILRPLQEQLHLDVDSIHADQDGAREIWSEEDIDEALLKSVKHLKRAASDARCSPSTAAATPSKCTHVSAAAALGDSNGLATASKDLLLSSPQPCKDADFDISMDATLADLEALEKELVERISTTRSTKHQRAVGIPSQTIAPNVSTTLAVPATVDAPHSPGPKLSLPTTISLPVTSCLSPRLAVPRTTPPLLPQTPSLPCPGHQDSMCGRLVGTARVDSLTASMMGGLLPSQTADAIKRMGFASAMLLRQLARQRRQKAKELYEEEVQFPTPPRTASGSRRPSVQRDSGSFGSNTRNVSSTPVPQGMGMGMQVRNPPVSVLRKSYEQGRPVSRPNTRSMPTSRTASRQSMPTPQHRSSSQPPSRTGSRLDSVQQNPLSKYPPPSSRRHSIAEREASTNHKPPTHTHVSKVPINIRGSVANVIRSNGSGGIQDLARVGIQDHGRVGLPNGPHRTSHPNGNGIVAA
mmetsp:Transcript_23447/g.39315  ORF Transcript_23447/g.39315 Transcript_23447/m.39315 type:complete len:599 (+) Transcript_23447:355-2151(+)